MGLVIEGTRVLVDHASKDHLVTTPEGNPKSYRIKNKHGELDVYSVFTRLKSSGRSRTRAAQAGKPVGDNCPLIYALKGKEDLSTDTNSIKLLVRSGKIIVQSFGARDGDVLICAPSSHTLVSHFATLLGKQLGIPVVSGTLAKSTIESAVADIDVAIALATCRNDRKDLIGVKRKLSDQKTLALKEVPVKYRSSIRPFVCTQKALGDEQRNLILVDDLVASGTSLIGAKNVLNEKYPGRSFRAITLFSDV